MAYRRFVQAPRKIDERGCDSATVATVRAESPALSQKSQLSQGVPRKTEASGSPTVADVAVVARSPLGNEKVAALSSRPFAAVAPVPTGLDERRSEWWRRLTALPPDEDPCPGFRRGQWAPVRAAALDFIASELSADAVAAGWTETTLFGVERTVGLARLDCCGVLMFSRGARVMAVSRDALTFAGGQSGYRFSPPPKSVPVWLFGSERGSAA